MEVEIVATEKKYEAILDYCLSDTNIPKYHNKIYIMKPKWETTKKNTLEI